MMLHQTTPLRSNHQRATFVLIPEVKDLYRVQRDLEPISIAIPSAWIGGEARRTLRTADPDKLKAHAILDDIIAGQVQSEINIVWALRTLGELFSE
jgi:hypothetical protein